MLFLIPWEGPSGIRCLAPLFAVDPERARVSGSWALLVGVVDPFSARVWLL
jgi:hypothetical protein